MSLLWRKKADVPVGQGFLTDYLAQNAVAPDMSIKPDPTFGVQVAALYLQGVDSSEAFGLASVIVEVQATSLVSGEAVGSPLVSDGIALTGIASGEAFGLPIVFPVPVEEDGGGAARYWRIKRQQEEELLLVAMAVALTQ